MNVSKTKQVIVLTADLNAQLNRLDKTIDLNKPYIFNPNDIYNLHAYYFTLTVLLIDETFSITQGNAQSKLHRH